MVNCISAIASMNYTTTIGDTDYTLMVSNVEYIPLAAGRLQIAMTLLKAWYECDYKL